MEVCQILVISENLYGKRGAVEAVSPGFQSMYDSKEFSIIDIVVPFSWDE